MAIFKSITISQIAEKAKVSVATVSRTLNGTGQVKKETADRIREIIKEMEVEVRNPVSRDLKIILASFPEFTNPFYSGIIDGISSAAKRKNYNVVLYKNENFNSEFGYDFLLNNNLLLGIILVHNLPKNSNILQRLSAKAPVVMCSEHLKKDIVPYVAIDDYSSARNAVNYLISTGRTKIALINSPLHNNYAIHREKGYRDSLIEAKLEIREDWILHIPDINYALAMNLVSNLFKNDDRPDACFCVSDVFAAASINAAKSYNLSIPNDVSIIGFDDIMICTMSNPTITTIRQPKFQLGFQSCNLLIELVEGLPSMSNKIILETDLVVRDSTV
jgi:LacI family repressor for deo operon, udp, cdd, tsx, nupC, and nupG